MAERELSIVISAKELATAVINKVGEAAKGLGISIDGIGEQVKGAGQALQNAFEHPVDAIKSLAGMVQDKLVSALGMLGPIGVGAAAGLSAIALAGAAVGATVWALADGAAAAGNNVKDFSERTGIAVANVGKWDFATKAAGGSLGTLTGILQKLELQNVADDGGKFAKALADIGINADAFKRMDSEQQLVAIAKGFQQGPKSGNEMATATALMGKSGAEHIPLLKNLTGELLDQGEKLGVQWSDKNVNAADDFEVAVNTVQAALGGVGTRIGAEVLPALAEMVTSFATSPEFMNAVTAAAEMLAHGLGIAVEVVGHLIQAVIGVAAPFFAVQSFISSIFIDTLSGLVHWLGEVLVWFSKLPIISSIVSGIGSVFVWMKDTVVSAFTTVFTWLEKLPGVGPTIKRAMDSATSAFQTTLDVSAGVGRATDAVGGALLGVGMKSETAAAGISKVNRAHTEGTPAADAHANAIKEVSKKMTELSLTLQGAEQRHISLADVEKAHGNEIEDLTNKAAELGLTVPASIRKWDDAITQSKIGVATAEQMAKVAAETSKGFDQAQSAAAGALSKIGANYKGLVETVQTVQAEISKSTAVGVAAQLTAIDERVAKEKAKLGPIPDVYKVAYEKATDAIDASLRAQIAAIDAKEISELAKLKSKPDEYKDSYVTATKLMKGELDTQRANATAKSDDEKKKLGEIPGTYASAYGAATAILDTAYGKQKDIINATYDTLNQRLAESGVYTRAVLAEQLRAEQTTLTQMIRWNAEHLESERYTADQIVAQRQKVTDAQAAMGDGWAVLRTKLKTTLENIPATLAAAFQNGGDIMGAVQSIVSEVGAAVGGSLGKAIGGPLGEKIGAAVGSMLGSVVGMFSHAGRDAVKEFAASMGGFDALHAKLTTLGQAGEDYWVKLTQGVGKNNPEQAKKVIDEITAALAQQESELEGLVPTWKDAVSIAESYGGTIEMLGPKFQQQELSASAEKLVTDFKKLQAAGADFNDIMGFMADDFQTVISRALQYGFEVPEAMRPVLQTMVEQGKLTDENGNKLEDLSRITFAESLTSGFNRVIEKLDELINKLLGGVAGAATTAINTVGAIGEAIYNLPSEINFEVNGHYNPPPIEGPEGDHPAFASEAYVRSPTLATVGDVLGGEFVLKPKTVNTWLSEAMELGALSSRDQGGSVQAAIAGIRREVTAAILSGMSGLVVESHVTTNIDGMAAARSVARNLPEALRQAGVPTV